MKQTRKPINEKPKLKKVKPSETLSERNIGRFQNTGSFNTIYIGNLRYTEDEKSINKMFSRFGEVSYIRIIFNRESKQSTGIAFVQMPKLSEAKKAIEFYDNKDINGRVLKVSIAKDNGKSKKPKTQKTWEEIKAKKEKMVKELEEMANPVNRRKVPRTGLRALFHHLNG